MPGAHSNVNALFTCGKENECAYTGLAVYLLLLQCIIHLKLTSVL